MIDTFTIIISFLPLNMEVLSLKWQLSLKGKWQILVNPLKLKPKIYTLITCQLFNSKFIVVVCEGKKSEFCH